MDGQRVHRGRQAPRGRGWWVAIGLVVALSATLISPAVGGPRYLTVAQAKKTYLTKKTASQTYLKKTAATQTYLRRAGDTRVPVQPSSWIRVSNQATVNVTPRPHVTLVSTNAANVTDVDLFAPAYVVSPLGGTSYDVVGLEVCYEFADQAVDQAVVDRISLQRAGGSTVDPVDGGLTILASDGTGRVDNACTVVSFAPVPVLPGDSLGIGLRLDYPDANAQVLVGRGALVLRPHQE